MIVYIVIKNGDDHRLRRAEWSEFTRDLLRWVDWVCDEGGRSYGVWYSFPGSAWESMCACVSVPDESVSPLRAGLTVSAEKWRQNSIVWSEARMEFLAPSSGANVGQLEEDGQP